jgi:hypothetical protein
MTAAASAISPASGTGRKPSADSLEDGFQSELAGSQSIHPLLQATSTYASRRISRNAYGSGRQKSLGSRTCSLWDVNMNEFHHAIVWIDHQQARVLRFGPRGVDSETVHSSRRHEHLHHKANSSDSGNAPQDRAFLGRVGECLSGAATILVTGPANAKRELVSHLEANQPVTAGHVAALEPLDHPTDGQLEAFARKYFHADERMRSSAGMQP